jgi:hypothetical protein
MANAGIEIKKICCIICNTHGTRDWIFKEQIYGWIVCCAGSKVTRNQITINSIMSPYNLTQA